MNSLPLIGMLLFVVANLERIPLPQTDFNLSEEGFYFIPDENGDWLDNLDTDSVGDCAYHCNMNSSCRTFEYDDDINHCELFQVEPSPDQIGFDSSRLSYFGYVQVHPQLFSAFNKSCDACVNDRYLICYQGLCRCPWQTFWNGEICEKQRYAGKTCNGIDQCRNNPLGLTCNVVPICSATGFSPQICSMKQTVPVVSVSSIGNMSYNLQTGILLAISSSLTITFSLKDSGGHWLLDNITLINVKESVNVLSNGDFENGNLTDWNYCNPNSSQHASRLGEAGSPYNPKSGQQYYFGGPRISPDYLSQTIRSKENHWYRLSFWLGREGSGGAGLFSATFSY